TVNSTADDNIINDVANRVTLRDAIVDAVTLTTDNNGETPTGNDTIVFDSSVQGATFNLKYDSTNDGSGNPGTFGISAFFINNGETLTISGTGETINVQGAFRIFQLDPSVNVTLTNLTLQNGLAQGGDGFSGGGGAAGMGGAIFNQGIPDISN